MRKITQKMIDEAYEYYQRLNIVPDTEDIADYIADVYDMDYETVLRRLSRRR
jgi:hypothetical protein